MSYVIVLGNEKGGSGKTTTTVHLIFHLIRSGFSVASLDLDVRQLSLNRYLENRIKNEKPNILTIAQETIDSTDEDYVQDYFYNKFSSLKEDFLIIDTPGSNTLLSRIAHSFADLVITPINDSFIDLDLIAKISGDNLKSMKPSIYSSMLWEQKLRRFKRDKHKIDWVVIAIEFLI